MRLLPSNSPLSSSPWRSCLFSLFSISLMGSQVLADQPLDFDPDDTDSVKKAASKAAFNLVSFYHGNESGQTPGVMPQPFYWWVGGAMFQSLIDYWHFTGDDTYNDITTQALLHQTGKNADFKPENQTHDLGNDDQAFWGMAALTAAESKFPNPPDDQPQWLALAQAVFNEEAADWVKRQDTCGGGMMWQIFEFNPGFNYKNSISNGCMFNIAARLAAYTGNETYAHWAETNFNWMRQVNLIDDTYKVIDGAYTSNDLNCTKKNKLQWSYNGAIFLLGSATMYNVTNGESKWKDSTNGLFKYLTDVFFKNGILAEVSCEPVNTCNNDQQSFKAFTSRWMSQAALMAPFILDNVTDLIRSSSIAAAKQCSGPNNACGLKWTKNDQYDGVNSPGTNMAGMEVMMANLIKKVDPPANVTTGISKGDPSAGKPDDGSGPEPAKQYDEATRKMTTGDKAGASVLTAAVVSLMLGGSWWVMWH